MSNISRLTRPRLKRSHRDDNHEVENEAAGTIHIPAASDCSPKTCYSCSGVALGEALGSVVVPSSVAWRRDFFVALDGLVVVSSLDAPVRSSVAPSVCRRDDGVSVALLLLLDGDSPRVAFRVGLALAVGEPVADGLADTVAVGDAGAPGEAVAFAIGDAVAPGEAVAVVEMPPEAVVPVVVLAPAVPVTPVEVLTPTPPPPDTP